MSPPGGDSANGAVGSPDWRTGAMEAFTRRLTPDFPCVFAPTAQVTFAFAESGDTPADIAGVADALADYLRDLAALPPKAAARSVLAVMFRPCLPARAADEHARDVWRVLQYLHDHDPKPWPSDIPANPAHPFWSFCFAGVPLFINASLPTHRARPSRNLGPGMVLLIQTRAGIDLLAPPDRSGDEMRRTIRERVDAYDKAPRLPMFGASGRPNDRDWKIFVLPDDDGPIATRCPLELRPPSWR